MRILGLAIAAVLAVGSITHADGLIYKLPKDGQWVEFEMTMESEGGGVQQKGTGTLLVASVGETKQGDEQCRWIEFRMKVEMEGRKQNIVAKALIPIKHLAAGKAPIDHIKTCWLRIQEDRDPMKVEDAKGQRGGPLPMFLAGPSKAQKKLPAEEVTVKLGKYKCVGLKSQQEIKQGEATAKIDSTVRLSDKVPFGVVSASFDMKMSRNGREQEIKFNLKATSVGKGKKSALPDNK